MWHFKNEFPHYFNIFFYVWVQQNKLCNLRSEESFMGIDSVESNQWVSIKLKLLSYLVFLFIYILYFKDNWMGQAGWK